MTRSRPAVIYISHNGASSALVRSQVLPYLEGLADRGFDVDLFTFERDGIPTWRPADSVRWHPLRSRSGAGIADKAVDIAIGTFSVLRSTLSRRTAFLHARSYVAAAVAVLVGALARRPYVFDMRGFLPEEFLEAGYWSRSDVRYRALRLVEPVLLRRAAEIVVLTQLAAERLRHDPAYTAARNANITVIPCAVDLRRFVVAPSTKEWLLVYSGSLGSFYELDAMLRVFQAALAIRPSSRMLILNQRDHELVRSSAERLGVPSDALTILSARPDEMPGHLAQACVGIALVKQSPSKAASSAVKVAEYLACGLPVVVNSGLGDVAEQVTESGAGHVLPDYSDAAIQEAGRAVVSLADSPEAREKARRLAVNEYDLVAATDKYAAIYERLASR